MAKIISGKVEEEDIEEGSDDENDDLISQCTTKNDNRLGSVQDFDGILEPTD